MNMFRFTKLGANLMVCILFCFLLSSMPRESFAGGHWLSNSFENNVPNRKKLEAYQGRGQDISIAKKTVTSDITDFDVVVSLYNTDTQTNTTREPYEEILRAFACGVYESSNGVHRIKNIYVYTGSNIYSQSCDILWREGDYTTNTSSICATVKGRLSGNPFNDALISGNNYHIRMYDKPSQIGTLSYPVNPKSTDTELRKSLGFALAHEWGHFAYGLYDEYNALQYDKDKEKLDWVPHVTDTSPCYSIMNDQWKAVGWDEALQKEIFDFRWANFSTSARYQKFSNPTTVQLRMYNGKSCWETLVSEDDDKYTGYFYNSLKRVYFPALKSAMPGPSDISGTVDYMKVELTPDNYASIANQCNIQWMSDSLVVQLVIDCSGSMDGDKLSNAKLAAQNIVKQAERGKTTIGVISFNDTVTVVKDLTPLTTDSQPAILDSIQNNLLAVGNTAIGDASQKALTDLLAFHTSNDSKVVFLLSDGQNNRGRDPNDVISNYQNAHIPMYTFGYGLDADEGTLRPMAEETNGKYYYSPVTFDDISKVMADAFQSVSARKSLVSNSCSVDYGFPQLAPFVVESSLRKLDVSVNYTGIPLDANIQLISPSGTIVAPTSTDQTTAGDVQIIFSVDNPAAGTWTLRFVSNSSLIDFHYSASALPGAQLSYSASVANLTGDVVKYPTPLMLMATLAKELPINGAVAKAQVKKPDGTFATVTFRDDGMSPDSMANDGQYSAILDYDQNGVYEITVTLDNSNGTANLTHNGLLGADGAQDIPIAENFTRTARTQVTVQGVVDDDYGNYPDRAFPLPIGNSVLPGKIEKAGDKDAFVLDVAGMHGLPLAINVFGFAFGMDPKLTVYDEDKVTPIYTGTLATDKTKEGYLSVTVDVGKADKLYAVVSHAKYSGTGIYAINANVVIPDAPCIYLYEAGSIISQREIANFGNQYWGGDKPVKNFILENKGKQELTLDGPITLPAGFTLSGTLPSVIPPGGSISFTLSMDTSQVGFYSGPLTFKTNQPGRNPFVFYLMGVVEAPCAYYKVTVLNCGLDFQTSDTLLAMNVHSNGDGKGSVKIQRLVSKSLANFRPDGEKTFRVGNYPGIYYLYADGPLKEIYTEVPIEYLIVNGTLKTLTSKNGMIGWTYAICINRTAMTYDNPAGAPQTILDFEPIWYLSSPLKSQVTLSGVSLAELFMPNETVTASVSSKKSKFGGWTQANATGLIRTGAALGLTVSGGNIHGPVLAGGAIKQLSARSLGGLGGKISSPNSYTDNDTSYSVVISGAPYNNTVFSKESKDIQLLSADAGMKVLAVTGADLLTSSTGMVIASPNASGVLKKVTTKKGKEAEVMGQYWSGLLKNGNPVNFKNFLNFVPGKNKTSTAANCMINPK